MLNWFGSKSSRRAHPRSALPNHVQSDASSISQSTAGPLRAPGDLASASDVPLDDVDAHINGPSPYATTPSLIHSTEKEAATLKTPDPPTVTQSYPPETSPEGTLFTPQDAIIAQVFGRSVPATDPARAAASNAAQPSVSLATSDSVPPSSSARPGLSLPIYDPFSGVKLGEHVPMSPSTTSPGNMSSFAPIPAVDDHRLWSSLECILELQGEIAAMHADMECVGGRGPGTALTAVTEGGHVGSRKSSRRGQTLPVGDEEPEEPEPEGGASTGAAVSEISTEHSDGADEDEEDDAIHGYGKRRRDEEFARLAEQFAQRKAAIGGIMNKLDDLSTALKTFHALPPPLFDFATSPSRTDTSSSAPSHILVTSPSHSLHAYPRQSSSLFSSISPSQAMSSIVHPASPTPPVPPISTLAPPMSLSAPPGLGSVVAPVLPRTAVPTIIPDAPHMESPADMDPTQSIFQGLS